MLKRFKKWNTLRLGKLIAETEQRGYNWAAGMMLKSNHTMEVESKIDGARQFGATTAFDTGAATALFDYSKLKQSKNSIVKLKWIPADTFPNGEKKCLFLMTSGLIVSGIFIQGKFIEDIINSQDKILSWIPLDSLR